MLAKERQEYICEFIKQNGAVTTARLVEYFKVSIETVRRDLLVLEQKNQLQRVHGGAVALEEAQPFQDVSFCTRENDERERELSQVAASFVQDGDVIGIDAGSMAVCFAQALRERVLSQEQISKVTVVTYCWDVFDVLKECKEIKLILCGGHYLPQENSFCGVLALDTLRQLHMQKVFVFPEAISLQFGICVHQQELCEMQRQMLYGGDKVFVLADSSKFERKELLKLADMQSNYIYITDSGLKSGLADTYAENQITIIYREK